MHIWNIKALATQLRDGTLSERERMRYYLVLMVLLTAGVELDSYSPVPVSYAMIALSGVIIAGTTVGIYVTYLANRNGDDRDFIARSICLTLPVTIRIGVVFGLALGVYAWVSSLIEADPLEAFSEHWTWFHVVFQAAFQFFFYRSLWHHITWIARPKDVTDTSGASVETPSGRGC